MSLAFANEPGRSVMDAVIDFLRSKSPLILLDNCEHLIGAVAGLVENLLVSCPTLTIVCTSREALGVRGETLLQVPSLALPPSASAIDRPDDPTTEWFVEVGSTEAVRLFVDRASAVLSSFSLTPENAPAVVEICRRLDGIPLAIDWRPPVSKSCRPRRSPCGLTTASGFLLAVRELRCPVSRPCRPSSIGVGNCWPIREGFAPTIGGLLGWMDVAGRGSNHPFPTGSWVKSIRQSTHSMGWDS